MKIKIAHHIFASRKGYQTQFRSPDVTDSENAELESFSFGQTNDTNYMASLKKHPAFTVRKLRSGRWAVTRVFQGADDDYGRATLRFHTVLVSQKEWASLDFDVLPFLEHPALWQDTESTEISVEPDNSPLPQDIAEQVLFLLNQLTASSSPVIVDESICSLQIIRWIHRRLLDEEKEEFSYGYRVLSDAMDASLLCLARQALRTATPGVGRYDKMRVSAPSPFNPDYENMNMAYEKPAGSNKLAILIIITVCILGIAGAIFALVSVSNAQKEKNISAITQPARLFLEKNKQFIVDPLKRIQGIREAGKFIKKIQDLKMLDSEHESMCEELKKWISKTTQTGELSDKVNDLKVRLAKQRLQVVSHTYPIAKKIADVKEIEKEFKNVLGEIAVSDSSSSRFFGNVIDDLEREVHESHLLRIARWENKIKGLIIADPNAVEEIQTILKQTDPNHYTLADPNQINFGDPNLPNYIDPNISDWTNPKRFPKFAEQNIGKLKGANKKIRKLLGDSSLKNAKNSRIEGHPKLASEYEAELRRLQDSVNENDKAMDDLKQKAKEIAGIEGRLISGRNPDLVLEFFMEGFRKYEQKLGTTFNPEKVWVNHLKWFVLDFYAVNIEPNIDSEEDSFPYNNLKRVKELYKLINGSSLSSKPVFKSLKVYYQKLERQEKNKFRQ